MSIKNVVTVLVLFVASCNGDKNDNDAAIRLLNEQSLKCISIMNQADAQKTTAMNAGDAATALILQTTIDSAALENAKIGQQLMKLKGK